MHTFKCFKKNQFKDIFVPTEFSDIIIQEKTSILFKFIKCKRYYVQILIDNEIKNIVNGDEMKIEIKVDKEEKNLFKKKNYIKKKREYRR